MAFSVAQKSLPEYSHEFSPRTFTQHQLFACLVLKSFLNTDYRGVVALLADCPSLAEASVSSSPNIIKKATDMTPVAFDLHS